MGFESAAKTALVFVTLLLGACGGAGEHPGEDGVFPGHITLRAFAESPTAVTLSWTEPTGGVSVSPYNVARNDSSSRQTIGSTQSLTYTAAGLAPATEYCFVIKNPLTANTMSNTACSTTGEDTTAPTVPTGLMATAISPAEVELNWAFSGDNHAVAGYNIYRDGQLLMSQSAILAIDRTANPETSYCYTISAFDSAGNESATSSQGCATLPADTEVPTVPADVGATITVENSQTVVTISWQPASDDGVVRKYRIYRNEILLVEVAAESFADSDIAAGGNYCYTISAVDAADKESLQSEPACAREGFRTQQFGIADIRHTSITVDGSNLPVIAYKQNIFSGGETRIPLYAIRPISGNSAAPLLLEEGANTFFFNDAYVHALVVDDTDTIHVAHKNNGFTTGEAIRHLQATGAAVLGSTVQTETDSTSAIGLAIGSNGVLHTCFDLGSQLFYAHNLGGAWMSIDLSTVAPLTSGARCDIAIDSNDAVHISYLENRSLRYATNRSGVWETQTVDLHSGSNVGIMSSTSIALDTSNNAHIAYVHDYERINLEYATNASGSWSHSVIDDQEDTGYFADIAIDSTGAAHISYIDLLEGRRLKYASNRSGQFTNDTIAVAGIGNAAIAVDSHDRIHLVYINAAQALAYTTNAD